LTYPGTYLITSYVHTYELSLHGLDYQSEFSLAHGFITLTKLTYYPLDNLTT